MTKTSLKIRIISLIIVLATVVTSMAFYCVKVKAATDNDEMLDYSVADNNNEDMVKDAITDNSNVAVPSATSSDDYNGGGAIANISLTVYNERGCKTVKGTVYDNEGFTILRKDTSTVYFIQYSTPDGARRGYIKVTSGSRPNISDYSSKSCVALVKNNATVYYGNSTTVYEKAGSVSKGEYVVVVAKSGSWSYIEYNTIKGRKRGYITNSNLTPYHEPNSYGEFYLTSKTTINYSVIGKKDVSTGTSDRYVKAGYVEDEDVVIKNIKRFEGVNTCRFYIIYNVDGSSKKKTGFILGSDRDLILN